MTSPSQEYEPWLPPMIGGGLKSPATSETDGVNARESQINNSWSSVAPNNSSMVSSTNSTDVPGTYIIEPQDHTQPSPRMLDQSLTRNQSRLHQSPSSVRLLRTEQPRNDFPVASVQPILCYLTDRDAGILSLTNNESSQRDPVGIHCFTSVGIIFSQVVGDITPCLLVYHCSHRAHVYATGL